MERPLPSSSPTSSQAEVVQQSRSMRAVVIPRHGGSEVLEMREDWPRPVPGVGETLVEVRACALNYLDIFVRRGMPGVHTELPHISGGDASGVVATPDPSAPDLTSGQRVLIDPHVPEGAIGENRQGAMCEYIAVPTQNLIPLDDDTSFVDAAALPIAYGTAWKMLIDRGHLASGETVLVLGASGGVGTACIQIANLMGATTFAGTSAGKEDKVLGLGADEVIDTGHPDWSAHAWSLSEKKGFDVVIDYTGRATWSGSIRCTKGGGRILTCGATTGYEVTTDLRYVWTREQSIIGSNGWTREGLIRLLALVKEERLRPVIDRVLPLDEARSAEDALEQRQVFGKIVLTP